MKIFHCLIKFAIQSWCTIFCPWCAVMLSLSAAFKQCLICFFSVPRVNGHSKSERVNRDSAVGYDSASVMSSELESSSFIDSEEDEDASRSDGPQCLIWIWIAEWTIHFLLNNHCPCLPLFTHRYDNISIYDLISEAGQKCNMNWMFKIKYEWFANRFEIWFKSRFNHV